MTIELTYDRAVELLKAAVEDRGADYEYVNEEGYSPAEVNRRAEVSHYEVLRYESQFGSTACQYVHGDQPGCIVGHVLHAAGVPLETLRECEGNSASVVLYELMGYELLTAPMDGAWDLLNTAQDYQDHGEPWGEAVRKAIAATRA